MRCFSPPGYIEVSETLDEQEARRVVHENCGVYRFTHQGVSITLAGDSNLPAWQRITGYYSGQADEDGGLSVLASQVLHASHHGSRTFVKDDKDEEAWPDALKAIDPADMLISVGADDRHGHPRGYGRDLHRARCSRARPLQTKHDGTLVLEISGEGENELRCETSFAERFGWDDDGGGEKSAIATPPGGGGDRARRPPQTPPPNYEKAPQRAPRRERCARI